VGAFLVWGPMTAEHIASMSKPVESEVDGEISRAKMTRSAGVVAFFTSLSRITGLLRDKVVAHLFGATAVTDAFVMAFTIPNMMRRFVAEGALTVAFIPVYTDLRKKGSEEDALEFFRATLGLLSIFLLILVGLGVLGASFLVSTLAWGFDDNAAKFALTTAMTQLMFPYVFFISLVGLFMGALNSRGHFAMPAASPVVLNLSMIAGAYFWSPFFVEPMMGQALGVVIGGVLQVLIHIPALKRYDLLHWPTLNYHLPGVIRLGRLLIPALFGVAAYQLNLIVLRGLGSYLPDGQLTYYYNADRLMQLALGIFAISIATAALPTMSAQSARGERKQLLETWAFSTRLTNFITIPAAVGLLFISVPIASVLWQSGKYTWPDVQLTAYITMAFAPGLIAIAVMRTTVQVFYALEDMKSPVWISAACVALNLGFGLWLLQYEVVGLAIAFTLSCFAQMLLLIVILRRKIGPIGGRALLLTTMRQTLSASAACGIAWSMTLLADWSLGPTPKNAAILLVSILTAIAVYGGLESYFGSQEVKKIWALVSEKLNRRR
jgi:putative peptidoglycan lipid II flippase